MSTAAEASTLDQGIFSVSTGVSDESERLWDLETKYALERRKPALFAWRDLLAEEVASIFDACSVRGWDGYDAEPASPDSVRSAFRFVENLPEGIQSPIVVPEPDGDIAFEWRTANDTLFSVSTTRRTLVYAGRFGGSSKQYGEEPFFGPIHPKILQILAQHFLAR
jgi:hypothetical protein